MAPKKEKAEKPAKGDAAADMILHYLRKQNRPYSATDISANLHNKVTKAATQKILKDLRERKEIDGRDSGKQSVYHVIQKPEESPSPDELAEMDKRTQQLRDEISNLNTTAKALRSTLSSLNSTLSTADLRAAIARMDAERAEILDRLASLRSGDIQPVSKEEKQEVDKQAKTMEKSLTKRKKIVKEMWGQVLDNTPNDASAIMGLRDQFDMDDED
ncbi:hypothetical protein FKW77_000459 [Venturia effusa]|uniref:Homologous-pairing protein 2 winged helix domain-containing protein n=1 Tax=Venturia effusa TaxID=50376 RepID=A0A517LQF6_9PEZI|nr:hypothetical protein FKW77_000459 [Venturia effusa]